MVSQLLTTFWGRILVGLVALFALLFIIRPAVVVTTAKLFGDETGTTQLYIDQDEGSTLVPSDQ